MSYVAVVGGAIMVGGALLQGSAQRKAAGAQAAEYQYEGQQGIEAAQQQAAIIQRAAQYAVGRATAQYAASGVAVGEGSAQETSTKIENDATHDAYMSILSAQKKANALQVQGALGTNTAAINADSSVLAAGGKAVSGWATAGGF